MMRPKDKEKAVTANRADEVNAIMADVAKLLTLRESRFIRRTLSLMRSPTINDLGWRPRTPQVSNVKMNQRCLNSSSNEGVTLQLSRSANFPAIRASDHHGKGVGT